MTEKIPVDWKSIICRGVESEELDYKAAVNWHKLSRPARAKFVRHCLAMANTRGGYIVVGVGEDSAGQPSLYTGLTNEQAKSFDPTIIGNFINKYADPEIDFTLERPEVDGKIYAIFVIRRFSDIPHVCGYGLENELVQGTFYIRTADAASRPAYRASEIHGIIQRALRNQREILGRMIRGVLYENRDGAPASGAQSHFAEDREHSKTFFVRRKHPEDTSDVLLEIAANPPEYIAEKFSLSEIKLAVSNVLALLPENYFITEDEMTDSYFSNMALRFLSEKEPEMWQIFKTGMFHYVNYRITRNHAVGYQTLVRLLAETVNFISLLYAELGYDDALLDIRVRLDNVENIALSDIPAAVKQPEQKPDYVCRIPEVKITLQRTAADLASGRAEHTARIVKEVCERFNLPDGRHQNLLKLINGYQGERY
ncbi:MAG: ATP-binding protein [Victivallaceae bacterium]